MIHSVNKRGAYIANYHTEYENHSRDSSMPGRSRNSSTPQRTIYNPDSNPWGNALLDEINYHREVFRDSIYKLKVLSNVEGFDKFINLYKSRGYREICDEISRSYSDLSICNCPETNPDKNIEIFDSFRNTVSRSELLLETKNPSEPGSFQSKKGLLNITNYYSSHPLLEKGVRPDSLWWEEEILRNLHNWCESDEKIAGALSLLKDGGDAYLRDSGELSIWQLLRNNLPNPEGGSYDFERDVAKNTSNEIQSLNDSNDLLLVYIMRNLLSNLVYMVSKHISLRLDESDWIRTLSDKRFVDGTNHVTEDVVNNVKNHGFIDSAYSLGKISYHSHRMDPLFLEWVGERKRSGIATSSPINRDIPSHATEQGKEPTSFPKYYKFMGGRGIHKILHKLFPKRKNNEDLNLIKPIRYALLDILSMDETEMDFYPTGKTPKGFGDEKSDESLCPVRPIPSDSTRFIQLREIYQNLRNIYHSATSNPASGVFRGGGMDGREENDIPFEKLSASPELFHSSLPTPSRSRERYIPISFIDLVKNLRGIISDPILTTNEPDTASTTKSCSEGTRKEISVDRAFHAAETPDTTGTKQLHPSPFLREMKAGTRFVGSETSSLDSYDFVGNDFIKSFNFRDLSAKLYRLHESPLYMDMARNPNRAEYIINGYCMAWKTLLGSNRFPHSRNNWCGKTIPQIRDSIYDEKLSLSGTKYREDLFPVRNSVMKSCKGFQTDFGKFDRDFISIDAFRAYGKFDSSQESEEFLDVDPIATKVDSSNSVTNSFVSDGGNDFPSQFFGHIAIPDRYDESLDIVKIDHEKMLRIYFYEANASDFIDFSRSPPSRYRGWFIPRSRRRGGRNRDLIYLQLLKGTDACDDSSPSTNDVNLFFGDGSNSIIRAYFYETFPPESSRKKGSSERFSFTRNRDVYKILLDGPKSFPFLTERDESLFSGTSIQKNRHDFFVGVNPLDLAKYVGVNNLSEPDKYISRITDSRDIDHPGLFLLQSINPLLIPRNDSEKYPEYFAKSKVSSNEKVDLDSLRGGGNPLRSNLAESTQQIRLSNSSNKSISCHKLWFFTLEWWEYILSSVVEILDNQLFVLGDRFESLAVLVFRRKVSGRSRGSGRIDMMDSESDWVLSLLKEIEYPRRKRISRFSCSQPHPIDARTILHLILLSFFVLPHLIRQNYLSIAIGSDYLYLWNYFDFIQNLLDTSLGIYFNELIHRNRVQLVETGNFLIYVLRGFIHRIKHFEFYLLTEGRMRNWLVNHKSSDLPRRGRYLLVQSLVAKARVAEYDSEITSRTSSSTSFSCCRITQQQGLFYLQHLARICREDMTNRPNYPSHSAERWVSSVFWQEITSSQKRILGRGGASRNFRKVPATLNFGSSPPKGILLIGPIETGRSYLVKNFSTDSYVPLLQISVNKLLYNKPDVITENWMNILIESLRRLNPLLELAKKMSPCLIWVRNIHQLNINHSTQNVESDPTFLLGILPKYFRDTYRDGNDVIVIGSTNIPEKVDPALISPNRLDRVINVRIPNMSQRRKRFPILLRSKKFPSKRNVAHFDEFGYRTMGYNMRDLSALANEVLLISLAQGESTIYIDTLGLALCKQISGSTHTDKRLALNRIYKTLLYEVGKVITRDIFVKNSVADPSGIGNFLWRRRFYHLSKSYSEAYIHESSIREFTISSHISGCLAGAAARDSFFFGRERRDNSIPLNVSVGNESHSAFSLFESLLTEFPWLEFCSKESARCGERVIPRKNYPNLVQGSSSPTSKNIFTYEHERDDSGYASSISHRTNNVDARQLSGLKNDTYWSPMNWRFSFLRSHLFDWIKRPNELELQSGSGLSVNGENTPAASRRRFDSGQSVGERGEQRIYGRILPGIRRRNVQELESQFKHILLEEQFEILGFSKLSTQYRAEYQSSPRPRLYVGKRILWDPTFSVSKPRHFVFSYREFFTDEEMLRRLYVTYGAKRERSRSRQRMKRFFLGRGYNKDLVTKLSIRWWNQLPTDRELNVNALKRIEQIGVQLKRPQIFTPVYLYQRWLIENSPEKFARFDVFSHRLRWLRINDSLFDDAFVHETLLESYRYLLKFFLSNKILLDQMIKILLGNGWFFRNELGLIPHETE